jgi:tRNA (guanine37-N1)-methyltransferase
MFHIKVGNIHAEMVKKALLKSGLLDRGSLAQNIDGFTYFPVLGIGSKNIKNLLKSYDAELVDITAKKADKFEYYVLLKEALGINADKIGIGYDKLGNIAVVEPRNTERKKVVALARCIIKANPGIETVLAKAGPVYGEYRKRRLSYVYGRRTFIATYKENGCMFRFDTRRTFFSTRLAYERKRISDSVKKKENIVVMFAGFGPFAIEIAKAHKDCSIVGIELNRYAYTQMVKNIDMNKTYNVTAVLGDVKEKAVKYKNFADRVIMPLPKDSTGFLDQALAVARDKCVVHFYSFVSIDGGKEKLMNLIRKHAKDNLYNVKFLLTRSVRPYSKEEEEIVLDYRIRFAQKK